MERMDRKICPFCFFAQINVIGRKSQIFIEIAKIDLNMMIFMMGHIVEFLLVFDYL